MVAGSASFAEERIGSLEPGKFADVIADRLNKVQGVLETNTHIAFRTYSADDLDAGFALGLDDA